MQDAVIVAGVRTAVGRAHKGSLRTVRPDDMAATVIKALVDRTPGLDPETIDDVVLGCAMPEAEQGLNIARIATLRAGLSHKVPAQTVNRFCSSGLQTIAQGAQQIMTGMADVIIAGGTESMSMVPMSGNVFAPNPTLAEIHPEVYIGMGLTAENVAKQYKISREAQDQFAFRSHQNAVNAIQAGKFKEQIVPLEVDLNTVDESGQLQNKHFTFDTDEGARRDTSVEILGKLKPVFAARGSVTAGNSSQTSDGAAAVMLMSGERAQQLGLKPLARFVSFAVAGVPPEVMGIGPIAAIPKALKLAGLNIEDLDLIELNEAFAAQALAIINELGLPLDRTNVNGGAIALGHPLGCSGAKLTVQLLNELQARQGRYGLVTMCIGGGMGAAGIFENLA
ncbi:MAG: acetyl-CoA C-acyltransferase [Herpetosiphonaceae bacterium]|nr:acetyl-CoA C-acyltransferase [Herpetosiphonaceae bacterium]